MSFGFRWFGLRGHLLRLKPQDLREDGCEGLGERLLGSPCIADKFRELRSFGGIAKQVAKNGGGIGFSGFRVDQDVSWYRDILVQCVADRAD